MVWIMSGDQTRKALNELFCSFNIREMSKGRLDFCRSRMRIIFCMLPSTSTVEDYFNSAWLLMQKQGEFHEYAYKVAVASKTLSRVGNLDSSMALNEFRVGRNIADIVIINAFTSVAWEIKSERDDLTRLSKQIFAYRKVFAKVNVITTQSHFNGVRWLVPGDVGIYLLDNASIKCIREPLSRPNKLSTKHIFNVMRLSEVKLCLEKNGFEIPGCPNTKLNPILKKEFMKLSPVEAHRAMIRTIFIKRNHLPLRNFLAQIPDYLRLRTLSLSLTKKDQARLIDVLNTPMMESIL